MTRRGHFGVDAPAIVAMFAAIVVVGVAAQAFGIAWLGVTGA